MLAVCAADTGLRASRRLNHFCFPERVSEFRDGLGFGFRAAAVRAFERLDAILRTGRSGRYRTVVPLVARRCNILRFLIRATRAAACRGLLALFGAGWGLRHRRRAHVMAERLHGFCFGLFAAGVCAGDRLHAGLRAGRLGRDLAAVPLVTRRGDLFGLRRGAAGIGALKCLDSLRRAGRSGRHGTVVPLVAGRGNGFRLRLGAAGYCAFIHRLSVLNAGRRSGRTGVPDVIMSSNGNSDRAGGNDARDSVFIQITNLGIDCDRARSKRRSIFDSEYERQHRSNVRRTSVIGRQPGSACPDFQAGHARVGKAYLFQHVRIVADAYLHTDDSRAAGNADRDRHFIAAAACSRCDGEIHGFSIGIRPRAQKRRHHENCEDYRQCFFHDFALLFI